MTRTRIQLGSGGWLFLFVAALILGAAIHTQANLLFWSFGLMVGGFFISTALALLSLRKVTVTRLAPSHGVVGEALVLRYRLANRKRLLPVFNVVIREHWGRGRRGWKKHGPLAEQPSRLTGRPTGWVLHLGANQTVQAEATCWPLRRGTLSFEAIEIATSFPFGVVRRVTIVPQQDRVLIYPRLYRLNRRLLGNLMQIDMTGRKQLDRGGGNEEFFGLRAYRPGDSLRIIDWKHSARTGELVSREFTMPSPPKLMLLLDLTGERDGKTTPPPARRSEEARPTPTAWLRHLTRKPKKPAPPDPNPVDPVERAIALAASLICEAYFHGYQVGLMVRGASCLAFPMHHSLPHRTRMLDALAMLDPAQAAASEQLPVEPSVIVHPGVSERTGRGMGATILGANRIDHYVREVESPTVDILSRRITSTNRREEIELARADAREEAGKPANGKEGRR